MRQAPSKDPSSLGSILVAMSVVTPEQLEEAINLQERSSLECLLGKLLVIDGYCTLEQLENALKIQEYMRSKSKAQRAIGIAEIARQSKKRTAGANSRVFERSVSVIKKATGIEHPIITPEMLSASKKDF